MLNISLRNLPPVGKLFVGITTALMLGVCLWSVFIFYVDKGLIEEGTLPKYMTTAAEPVAESDPELVEEQIEDIASTIVEDSLAELAPDWDSDFVEEQVLVDSATLVNKFKAEEEELSEEDSEETLYEDWKTHLRENVGLAHTHINGQTLLYFVLGLFLVFTSIEAKLKKILLWSFGIIVLTHTIGLSGEGFHWFFDDLLAISGVGLLVLIPYICFLVFADLMKTPEGKS